MRNFDDSAVTGAMGTLRREQSAAVKASHSHASVLRSYVCTFTRLATEQTNVYNIGSRLVCR